MFPLGSVLFPRAPLPLHVFEDRYRALVRHCVDNEAEFGVVLIERGSEVGGGDVRAAVGTAARIVEAVPFDDGRWALMAEGTRRIRVERWVAEDPYPLAEVVEVATEPSTPPDGMALAAERAVRRALARLSELGEDSAPATIALPDSPLDERAWLLASLTPVGPLDRQRLLAAPTTAARLELVRDLAEDAAAYFEARLAAGG